MNQFLFANNAQTTLAASISNVATTATLSPGSGALFPNPGAGQQFAMTFIDAATGLLNEVVYVTGRSGDVVTIVRAQEGTSAIAWSAGDLAASLVTAGNLGAMLQPFGIYVADTGAANAYAIAPGASIAAYTGGLSYNIIPLHTNTGASTLAVDGLAAKPIVRNDGSALQPNDIAIGGLINVVYQDVLGKFVITGVNPSSTNSAAIQSQAGNYAADTGTANAYIVTLAPVPAAYAGGFVVRFNAAHTNTAASAINVNGLGSKAIKDAAGNDLQPGDIVAGTGVELLYNGTNFTKTSFTPGPNSVTGTTGYARIPGTPLILQWAALSISSLPQNTNTPTGTVWGNVSVFTPIVFPNGVLSMALSMVVGTNGQFVFGAVQNPNTGGCAAYVTASSAATLPIVGYMFTIGY